jgi:hypothetical protein
MRDLVEARETIFGLELLYLVALLVAAATYIEGVYSLPSSLGTVPLAVPWFGALGAVIISLTGTVTHAADWERRMALWHISRPLVGASIAIVGVLIMQAGLTAVGSSPNSTGAVGTPGAPHNVLYYVVAFALGYREQTFRQLLKRLLDVILSPGTGAAAPAAPPSLTPASGPVAGGTAVAISGSGLSTTQSVTFGATAAQFTIISDSRVNAVAPAASQPGPAGVIVVTADGSLHVGDFAYT